MPPKKKIAAKPAPAKAAPAKSPKFPRATLENALKIAYATQGRIQYRDVFLLVSALRKFLNLEVRLGGALGLPSVRSSLRVLKSYWPQGGR